MRTLKAAAVATALAALGWAGSASAQNMVANPGLESGSTGWSGGQVVADQPHSGAACLKIDDASVNSSVAASSDALLPVAAGKTYSLKVWIRAAVVGQQAMVTLEQYDASQKWISGHNYDWPVTVGTDWSEFSRILRAFSTQTAFVHLTLRPVVWTDAGELTGTAWFDDVDFEEISDPLTSNSLATWLVQGPMPIWRSPAEQKVRRDVAPPAGAAKDTALRLEVAKNESEPAVLVLAPAADDTLQTATLTDLAGPTGASISQAAMDLREVAYLNVVSPTDSNSAVGPTPDPLPVLSLPLPVKGGQQSPLWLTLRVPESAIAGDYTGTLHLGFAHAPGVDLPLAVHVWGFALPKEHHLRTAYGVSLYQIDRYHHLQGDPAMRRQVFQLYLQDFATHRISPYDPFGDDRIGVNFPIVNWPIAQVVPDPAAPASGNHVLEVDDQSTTQSVGVRGLAQVHLAQGKSYQLSWKAKTDSARSYALAVDQYDAADNWISGHNLDFVQPGDGTWGAGSGTISASQLAANEDHVRLVLYACPWSADGAQTGTTWFDDLVLVEQGGTTNLVSNGDMELKADQVQPTFDFTKADAALSFALDGLGMDAFRHPLPFFAGGGGSIHDPGSVLGYAWGTPEYQAIFSNVLLGIDDHLQQRGWLEKAYAYWYDEPDTADYPFVVQGMQLLKQMDPRLKRLLTEQYETPLVGNVDIWSPLLDLFDVSWAKPRQAAGDQVWWYVCTGPKAPYPNDFIDHAGIEHRLRHWMAWQYGVQGDLYWETTYWSNDDVNKPPALQDPWTDPMSHSFDATYGQGEYGNGDGRLLYPPRAWADGTTRVEGPTPSIRWELIREGIEDFEYFWLLRDAAARLETANKDPARVAAARALLDLPATLFTSTTSYTSDPTLMQDHRHKVALMLEQIEGELTPEQADAGSPGRDASLQPQADAQWELDASPGADAQLAQADAAVRPDASAQAGVDAGASSPTSSGCGCEAGSGGPTLVLAGALLAMLRRKRG